MRSFLSKIKFSGSLIIKAIFDWVGTQLGALILLNLLFIIGLSLNSPAFLTKNNMFAVCVAMAGYTLCSMGSVLVLLTGGFDLSVGSSYGLAGIIVAISLLSGLSVWTSIFLGIITGLLIGLINGVLVTKIKINPFIATLGTMAIARGFINVLTKGYSISGLPESFTKLADAKIIGLPPSLIVMVIVVLIIDLSLRFLRPARQLYYIGSSSEYARLVGIPVSLISIIAYILSGILAAIGGILFTARTAAASQQAGIGIEMIALLAPFLGGVGFAGKGTALGAFMGAMLVALIINAIQLVGIASLWQNVILGACLIFAALIGMSRTRQINKHGLSK
jgi:ribose transport system permease protein